MDSDNDSYQSENEFYYPDKENVLPLHTVVAPVVHAAVKILVS